jgi:hypothetical protein
MAALHAPGPSEKAWHDGYIHMVQQSAEALGMIPEHLVTNGLCLLDAGSVHQQVRTVS